MCSSFAVIDRTIINAPWYKNIAARNLFVHLVLTSDEKGQRTTTRRELAEELGLSSQQLRAAELILSRTNKITSKSTNKNTVITLANYDNIYNERTNKTTNQTTNQTTNEPPASPQHNVNGSEETLCDTTKPQLNNQKMVYNKINSSDSELPFCYPLPDADACLSPCDDFLRKEGSPHTPFLEKKDFNIYNYINKPEDNTGNTLDINNTGNIKSNIGGAGGETGNAKGIAKKPKKEKFFLTLDECSDEIDKHTKSEEVREAMKEWAAMRYAKKGDHRLTTRGINRAFNKLESLGYKDIERALKCISRSTDCLWTDFYALGE